MSWADVEWSDDEPIHWEHPAPPRESNEGGRGQFRPGYAVGGSRGAPAPRVFRGSARGAVRGGYAIGGSRGAPNPRESRGSARPGYAVGGSRGAPSPRAIRGVPIRAAPIRAGYGVGASGRGAAPSPFSGRGSFQLGNAVGGRGSPTRGRRAYPITPQPFIPSPSVQTPIYNPFSSPFLASPATPVQMSPIALEGMEEYAGTDTIGPVPTKFIEECASIIVIHNLEQFGPVNRLEISNLTRNYLFGPTSPTAFVLTVLFEKEDLPVGLEQMNIKANNKRKQKKNTKSKRQIALTKESKLRKKAFNNIFLHCAHCNSKKVFQTVRHRENEREFTVFPFVSNSDALKRLTIRIQALPASVPVTIFGPSDIIGSKIQKELPERLISPCSMHVEAFNTFNEQNPVFKSLSKQDIASEFASAVGKIILLNSSSESVDCDGDAVFSDFNSSSDSVGSASGVDLNKWYVDIAAKRVVEWANRQSASLPKTIQKLENSVKNLLKVQLPDSLKQKIIRNIIFQLSPCSCQGCSSFALLGLLPSHQAKKVDLEPSHLPIYNNAVQLLSKVDQLPNSVNGLANVLANCFSPVQVDFRTVYERLLRTHFITEDENDSTVIHFNK